MTTTSITTTTTTTTSTTTTTTTTTSTTTSRSTSTSSSTSAYAAGGIAIQRGVLIVKVRGKGVREVITCRVVGKSSETSATPRRPVINWTPKARTTPEPWMIHVQARLYTANAPTGQRV